MYSTVWKLGTASSDTTGNPLYSQLVWSYFPSPAP